MLNETNRGFYVLFNIIIDDSFSFFVVLGYAVCWMDVDLDVDLDMDDCPGWSFCAPVFRMFFTSLLC